MFSVLYGHRPRNSGRRDQLMKHLFPLMVALALMVVVIPLTEDTRATGPSALTVATIASANSSHFATIAAQEIATGMIGSYAAIANTDDNPVKKLTHVIASGNEVPIPFNIAGSFIGTNADASYYTAANWNALDPPIATAALMPSDDSYYDDSFDVAPVRGSPNGAIALRDALASSSITYRGIYPDGRGPSTARQSTILVVTSNLASYTDGVTNLRA